MAQHVWSVLCEKVLTDTDTSVMSLVAIAEKIITEQSVEEIDAEMKEAGGLAHPMQLVTWCVRSDREKPEAFSLRARWLSPKGDYIPLGEHHVKLDNAIGVRAKIALKGVPWRGVGVYWLIVDKRDDGGKWTSAARLPFELAVKADAIA